ncbi:MAG: hypothetical protein P1P82_01645 [Bacteroidales bacterium]|nr:hypothetical protein [Bacteroidales bacterium]MDT8430248.1 hypothetical protein [Bacteroidales bacterium]
MYQKPEIICIAVAFLFVFSISFSQDSSQDNSGSFSEILTVATDKYGTNQQLANGVYFEDTYRGARGHPYLLEDQFTRGAVTFYGKEYRDVSLKYDLYGQQLLISHQEDAMVFTTVLAKELTETFIIHGICFRKLVLMQEEPSYYQVVAEEEVLKCYYAWFRTRYESIGENENKLYSFTEDQQRRYLLMDQEVYRYFNNWTFVRIFDRSLRGAIRSHLRQNDLKIQKATDEQVGEVIRFITQLIHPSDL